MISLIVVIIYGRYIYAKLFISKFEIRAEILSANSIARAWCQDGEHSAHRLLSVLKSVNISWYKWLD